jgi:Fe-S-cluster containining protein
MLFDHCAECQSCCRIDAGFPPLEITLSKVEKQGMGSLCISTTCEFLGAAGCTLGDDKPFGCQLYPLAYNPKTQDFFFDAACPLMPTYRQQLSDPDSEASQHLSRMTAAVQQLAADEPSYLRRNFRVDSEYFDIQPLLPIQAKKKARS